MHVILATRSFCMCYASADELVSLVWYFTITATSKHQLTHTVCSQDLFMQNWLKEAIGELACSLKLEELAPVKWRDWSQKELSGMVWADNFVTQRMSRKEVSTWYRLRHRAEHIFYTKHSRCQSRKNHSSTVQLPWETLGLVLGREKVQEHWRMLVLH